MNTSGTSTSFRNQHEQLPTLPRWGPMPLLPSSPSAQEGPPALDQGHPQEEGIMIDWLLDWLTLYLFFYIVGSIIDQYRE